ncbi:hypothetical protein MSAN_01984400 [Mycena sanguinolenta]|uniref:Uncharacterized protein n=1 Tax=Mycena sanguinolenta TaxID=230812 RepID=A0A8H6XM89_9AGAR|nr:hypothetical protein MSAN_01984400 [Mycena sanguinolenta]
MRLTETPLFQEVYWASEPLIDGSLPQIPPDALGPRYSPFLVGMQELDVAACPDPHRMDIDWIEFRHALRIPLPPTYLSLIVNPTGNYTNGRARVWIYLLHFKILDLLLAPLYPRRNPRPFSALPGAKLGGSADKVLRKLCKWPASIGLESLIALLEPPSSLWSILNHAKLAGEKSHLAICHRNIQSCAAGLIWILELGSENVPVRKNGVININPSGALKDRYPSSSLNTYDAAQLEKLGTAAKMLRSLSYVIFISPALALADLDLQSIQIDFSVQLELNHYLATSNHPVSALPHIERGILDILRHVCAKGIPYDQVISAELPPLLRSIPKVYPGDTARFTDLRKIYQSNALTASRPVTGPQLVRSSYAPPSMLPPRTDGNRIPLQRINAEEIRTEARARAQPQFSDSDSDEEHEVVSKFLLSNSDPPASRTARLAQTLPSEHRISHPALGNTVYRAHYVLAVSVVLLAAAVCAWLAT